MGKKTENNQPSKRTNFRKPKGFRMAYSLNNYQPVECTIISDQPFFYMDEEILIEEDSILSDGSYLDDDYSALESEIAALKTKVDAYDRISSEFKQDVDARLEVFIQDSVCFETVQTSLENQNSLDDVIEILSKSRMATSLLDFAKENNVSLQYSTQTENVSYDKKAGKILIRPDIAKVDQVLLTIQELRRHWQHRQGAFVHPLTFHPDQAVLINRAQLADLSVAVVRCGWELKLQGLNDIWSRIENSSISDLGRALAREALSDFRTLNNGQASAAVFETWFLSERCRVQDKKLIQAMLADYRGYVFDNVQTSKMISIDLICALGEQPFGKNYLAAYAHMIMNDPVFTDIRDRSNANFLWFIKFERSFIETERELQSSDFINKPGVDQAVNKDIIEDNRNENGQSRQAESYLQPQIFRDCAAKRGSNVIHVAFGGGAQSREGILS